MKDRFLVIFSNFNDIIAETNQIVLLKPQRKIYLKGKNITKFILPIIDLLYEPNSLDFLFTKLLEKGVTIDDKQTFLSVIKSLIEQKVIVRVNDNIFEKGTNRALANLVYPYNHARKLKVEFINIAIIDTTNTDQIIYLIDSLAICDCIRINVFVCNDIFFDRLHVLIQPYTSRVTLFNLNDDYDKLCQMHLIIIIQTKYYNETSEYVNELCVRRNIPLLNCSITEKEAVVGPFIIPNKLPCLECVTKNDVYRRISNQKSVKPLFNNPSIIMMCQSIILNDVTNYLCMGLKARLITSETIVIIHSHPFQVEVHKICSFNCCANIPY